MGTTEANVGTTGLRRSLRFWDLVLYGIILIQPTAPMPSFGIIYKEASGHVVTAILLAMIAMLFTSVSYGRMARAHPHGGSAFLYVGKEIHSSLGYITGWCLVMDYILNPLICTIWCSRAAMNFLPEVPYTVFAILFAASFTALNCNGVETSPGSTREWLLRLDWLLSWCSSQSDDGSYASHTRVPVSSWNPFSTKPHSAHPDFSEGPLLQFLRTPDLTVFPH